MIEWTREYTPEEVKQLEAAARRHHDIMGGLSTWKDECLDAAQDLDRRRREHERRFRRTRVAMRPATREQMIRYIEAVGATDVTAAPGLIHVPVTPVAGGIAFDPHRMTVSNLEEVYEALHHVARPEGRVLDRVVQVIAAYPNGLRQRDIVGLTEASKTAVKRALAMLELHGEVSVRNEPTRVGGSPRKRFYPANHDFSSIDAALEMGVV